MQQEDLVSTAIVFHKRLNPKLWSKGQLKKDVRFHLLEIAQNFIDFIGIEPLGLQDITISGSNAGYTFSRNSDLDLHLVVNIPKEREHGIQAGFAWRSVADVTVVYEDLGRSLGMEYGIKHATEIGHPIEYRKLGGSWNTSLL